MHLLPCIVSMLIDERVIMVSMVILIAMNGNNHIHLKQELSPLVHNGLDTNTINKGPMNWVSIVVLIAMNSNSHIHLKQALTFGFFFVLEDCTFCP